MMVSPTPGSTLAPPLSPTRARSVSQPGSGYLPGGPSGQGNTPSPRGPGHKYQRSSSSNSVPQYSIPEDSISASSTGRLGSGGSVTTTPRTKGRARSSSLVAVTEVGGDAPENVVDRLGVGVNENAAWVNGPGAWLIHPVMILLTKVLVDALPGMTHDVSWTIVNLGYITVSFLMFHHVTGVPFESSLPTGGAYDDLTLWEQIDSGAQYTPAKKWLTSVPIGLFLISTHYTKYDYLLFALNFAALVFVLFPKLPILHRLRFKFLPADEVAPTPTTSRPPSPYLGAAKSKPIS